MALYAQFESAEEGMEVLKKHTEIRDQMGGAMYWNMLNDECCEIANKVRALGGNYDEIAKILGAGTFR